MEEENAKKKRKTTQEDKEAAKHQQYLKRWLKEDLPRVVKLSRHGGAAMYDWKRAHCTISPSWHGPLNQNGDDYNRTMEFQEEVPDLEDLVGNYDILFGAGYFDSEASDGGKISRTMHDSTLTLTVKDDNKSVLCGDLQIQPTIAFDGDGPQRDAAWDNGEWRSWWERRIQMSLKFQRKLPLSFEKVNQVGPSLASSIGFKVRTHACPPKTKHTVSIKVIDNDGYLPWIPNEQSSLLGNPEKPDRIRWEDWEYKNYIQDMATDNRPNDATWCEQSWLCNHKGLPKECARRIRSFAFVQPPSPYFEWKRGDLLIYVSMCRLNLGRPLRGEPLPPNNMSEGKIGPDNSDVMYIARPKKSHS